MPNLATKIMIVRHAEKPAAKGPPHGVNIDGKKDKESLIPLGWQRAGALATLFAPSNGQFKSALLATPQTLFASGVGQHSNSLRPQETITPTSQLLGVTINTTFLKGKETALAAALTQCAGVVLVAWEHQNIPKIANAILGNATTVPQKWPGARFDLVWVFDLNGGTYTFNQVPQMLLAGDIATSIT